MSIKKQVPDGTEHCNNTPKTPSNNTDLDSARSNGPKYNFQYNCTRHDKKYEAFCQNCRVLICIDCILEDDHKAHEMVSISKALDIEKSMAKSNLGSALEFERNNSILKQKGEIFLSELKEKQAKNSLALRLGFEKIRIMVNEREKELEQIIRKSFDVQYKNLFDFLEKISNQQ